MFWEPLECRLAFMKKTVPEELHVVYSVFPAFAHYPYQTSTPTGTAANNIC